MVAIRAPSITFTPVGLSACIRKPIFQPFSLNFGALSAHRRQPETQTHLSDHG
jgi:hypothetical protein